MNWDYIAGFFDGEGGVEPHGKNYRIALCNTNKKALVEIKNLIGFGNICQPKKRKKHWKESWIYYIANQKDVYRFLNKIYNKVVIKKKKIEEAIPRLEKIIEKQEKRKKHTIKRRRIAERLRSEGLSYNKIGQIMGLDRGYIRRLIIRKWYHKKNNGGRSLIG